MRADTSLRPAKPPRGATLSSGEDIPGGHSVRARMVIAEIQADDVNLERLTEAQKRAGEGVFALAMAGYLMWLAPRIEDIQSRQTEEISTLRPRFGSGHARTPDSFAEIMRGWWYFTMFAKDIGAITEAEAQDLFADAHEAMALLVQTQADHQRDADPVARFFRLLSSAISAGAAHVAGTEEAAPDLEGHGPNRSADVSRKSLRFVDFEYPRYEVRAT